MAKYLFCILFILVNVSNSLFAQLFDTMTEKIVDGINNHYGLDVDDKTRSIQISATKVFLRGNNEDFKRFYSELDLESTSYIDKTINTLERDKMSPRSESPALYRFTKEERLLLDAYNYWIRGDFDQALAEIEKVRLNRIPQSVPTYGIPGSEREAFVYSMKAQIMFCNMAPTYEILGKIDKAIEIYRKIIKEFPLASSAGDNVIIDVRIANIRAKPNTNSKVIVSAGMGSQYLYYGEYNDWYRITNYESLSGAKSYVVYIGPFQTRSECKSSLDRYKRKSPQAYGLLVSHESRRVEIR